MRDQDTERISVYHKRIVFIEDLIYIMVRHNKLRFLPVYIVLCTLNMKGHLFFMGEESLIIFFGDLKFSLLSIISIIWEY